MFKRFAQLTVALAAVAILVLAPVACQKTEKPADQPPATGGQAKPGAEGRRLMQAKPKQQQQQTPAAPEQQPPAGEEPATPQEGADEGM